MRFKRLLGYILAAVLAISCMPVQGAYIDVEDTALAAGIDILEQLGIIEGYADAVFQPDEYVSAGEFEKCAARLFNKEAEATEDTREISYAEAVKKLLDGMGYGAVCEMQGGFPTGYLKMAQRIGLGSGAQGALTRKRLVALLCDALEAGVMEFAGMSGTETDFRTSDETVMKKFHDMVKIKGIMSYNGITSIDGSRNEAAPRIIVGGAEINTGDKSFSEYLGYDVTVYAYQDRADGTLYARAVVPTDGKNETVTVPAEDIERVYGGSSIRVETGTRIKTYTLQNAAVIYNGGYCTEYDDELLMPEEGFLELLDNDNDGRYELVRIYDTTDDVITGVNIAQKTVYLEEYGAIGYEDKEIFVYIDGKSRSISDVNAGATVSAAVSLDGNVTLWVSTKTVSGTLESRDNEYIVIGGGTYPVSAMFRCDLQNIGIGKSYTVLISQFGKAVKLRDSQKTEHYGWLMGILYDECLEEPSNVHIKLLSDSGAIERLPVGEKIRINDKSYKLDLVKFQWLGLMDEYGRGVPQMVKYTIDESGRITGMYTPEDKTAQGIYDSGFSLDKRVRGAATRMYRYNIGINYHIGAVTKVFYLPLENEIASADDEAYSVGGISSFGQDITYSNFDIYDTRPDRAVGVLVIRRSVAPAKLTDRLTDALMKRELGTVIKSRYTVDGGESEASVQMLASGKEITLKAQSANLTNSAQDSWSCGSVEVGRLRRGDVILFGRNEKNELSDFTVLLRAEELAEKQFCERTPGSITVDGYNDVALTPLHTVFGEVREINGTTYSLNVTQGVGGRPADNQMRHICASASTYVYVMDYDTQTWRIGSLADICMGDVVFARLYNYVPQQIVVFRGV